jgi:YVTN family beta-propeller protein
MKAISSNNLSYNCSFIDLNIMETEGTVELGESCYDVKVTPDGLWAVAGGYNNNEVKIIDLSTNSLATTVYTGQRPMVVEISPDGQYAYIGNIKSNTLSVVELDGVNSNRIVSKSCGVIGVYIPFFGIRSAVKVSPDGSAVLVAASFDDEVNVFDTQTNEFVASLPTGDFPLDIAFNNDGSLACVVNTFDNTYNIISVDGASSSVVFHEQLYTNYPMDVAYDDESDKFLICSASSDIINTIDPHTGNITGTQQTFNSPFHVEVHNGSRIIQYQGDESNDHKITFGDGPFQWVFPYAAAPFSFNREAGMIGVAMPGPDLISIIDLNPPTQIDDEEISTEFIVYPNPATNRLLIRAGINFNSIEIYDMKGHLIKHSGNIDSDGLDISDIIPGTYIVRIINGKINYGKLIVIN